MSSHELDFDAYKGGLRRFMSSQDHWKDYDFTQAGLDSLLSVLAYNSQMNAFSGLALSSETRLSTAQTRRGAVAAAEDLGYTPGSRRAARIIVEIRAVVSDPAASILELPKGSIFTAKKPDGGQINFTTTDSYFGVKTGVNEFTFYDVILYQGAYEVASFVFGPRERSLLTIPRNDIDTLLTEVYVQDGPDPLVVQEYNISRSYLNVGPQDQVFFVRENPFDAYYVQFGDGIAAGRKPKTGDAVRVVYFVTEGPEGNGLNSFALNSSSFVGAAVQSATVVTTEKSNGGAERESIETIKLRAPQAFGVRGKAVHDGGLQTVITERFPEFVAVEVYGGEQTGNTGTIFVSVVPAAGFSLTSARAKEIQKTLELTETIGGMRVAVTEPNFIDVAVIAHVRTRDKNRGNVKADVLKVLNEFGNDFLGSFNQDLEYSRLTAEIDDANPSIISSFVKTRLAITSRLTAGRVINRKFEYLNQLAPRTVSSNYVAIGSQSVAITDDGVGTLNMVTRAGSVIGKAGTINYLTGVAQLNELIATETRDLRLSVGKAEPNVVRRSGTVLRYDQTFSDVKILGVDDEQ